MQKVIHTKGIMEDVEFADQVEQLAIDRACEIFGCKYANVQPHSGSQANSAVYAALLNAGDKILWYGFKSWWTFNSWKQTIIFW